MLVTWKAPQVPKSSDIDQYIIRYHPVDEDDDTTERTVEGSENFVVLRRTWHITELNSPAFSISNERTLKMSLSVWLLDLVPNTEYLVSVICVYEGREGSPAIGTQRTGKFVGENRKIGVFGWIMLTGHYI